MATDDRRMHEGESRSLDDREPREREQERAEEGKLFASGDNPGAIAEDDTPTGQNEESALGGDVATRTGTEETPEEERTQ